MGDELPEIKPPSRWEILATVAGTMAFLFIVDTGVIVFLILLLLFLLGVLGFKVDITAPPR